MVPPGLYPIHEICKTVREHQREPSNFQEGKRGFKNKFSCRYQKKGVNVITYFKKTTLKFLSICLQVFISAALMEYYCSKVSPRVHFIELHTGSYSNSDSNKQQIYKFISWLIMFNLSLTNVIWFQDKAVAFKIFELGLKVFLNIIIFYNWAISIHQVRVQNYFCNCKGYNLLWMM